MRRSARGPLPHHSRPGPRLAPLLVCLALAACGGGTASPAGIAPAPQPTSTGSPAVAAPTGTPRPSSPAAGIKGGGATQPPPPASLPEPAGLAPLERSLGKGAPQEAYRTAVDLAWVGTFNELRMAKTKDIDAGDVAFVDPFLTPALRRKWHRDVGDATTDETALRIVNALVTHSATTSDFVPEAPWFDRGSILKPRVTEKRVDRTPGVEVRFLLRFELVGRQGGAVKRYTITKDFAARMKPEGGRWLVDGYTVTIKF